MSSSRWLVPLAISAASIGALGSAAAGAYRPRTADLATALPVFAFLAMEDPAPSDSAAAAQDTSETPSPGSEALESKAEPRDAVTQNSRAADGTASGGSSLGMEVTDFRQREPGDGDPISEPTRAYVSYDESNLYVVFLCEDDPDQIRARVVPREKITDDDRVVVFLDTFDDNQRAYGFEANPLGVQRDGIVTEGQDDDYTFDALWHSEGQLTATGYVVRMRIPFSSLRFSNQSAQTWGIALGRYIARKDEKAFWPHITDRVEGFVSQLGTLQGLERISAGRRLHLVPYGTMTEARFLDDEQDVADFRSLTERRFGLDAKAVLNEAVTVDLAVNPDFSQVEPDEPQVTVNERFEKRVDEKRPFFLENSGYFATPIELFFSRRIADPSGGARVTSKQGSWAIGGLFMNDREPGRVPVGEPLNGEQAYSGVLRVQREIGKFSTLGLFASDRELGGDFNRVYSGDTRLKLGNNWVVTGQIAQAETRNTPEPDEPAEPRAWGHAGHLKIRRDGRHVDYSASYDQYSPDFVTQLGFIEREGIRQAKAGWDYTFRPKKSAVQAWGPKVGADFVWGWDGQLLDSEIEFGNVVELPASTELEAKWSEIFERFEDRDFRLKSLGLSAKSEWLKWLGLSLSYERGLAVNHDPPDSVLPFRGEAQEVDVSMKLRPIPRLEFSQSFTHGWLSALEHQNWFGSQLRVYTNWILESKLKYQFNRELSVRAIANYEGLVTNPELSDEDEKRELIPDVLITYLLNPWTALHAGYSERFENVRLVAGEVVDEPRSNRGVRLPPTSVDRQLFVKVSYLLRP